MSDGNVKCNLVWGDIDSVKLGPIVTIAKAGWNPSISYDSMCPRKYGKTSYFVDSVHSFESLAESEHQVLSEGGFDGK